MSDMPSDFFREILVRLPAESLFRFRCVCKSWQSIIDDPSFVRSHTTTNHRSSSRLLLGTDTGNFYSFPLNSLNFVNGKQTIHTTQVEKLTSTAPQWMALCNGLILFFHHHAGKNWVIWNTLTGDFHELPQPDVIDGPAIPRGVAIGYDSTSDDYKVVRIGGFHGQDGAARTLIYSVKSKSWRTIMNCPFFIGFMIPGVYVNGAVHWISSRQTIVALDLATEEYQELQAALPPKESPEQECNLNAFDGYLVLSNADEDEMGRAWVMRGYGNGTDVPVWVELFSAEERTVFNGVEKLCCPLLLAYSDSERRVFVQQANRIIRWDIEKQSVKSVTIDGLPGSVDSFHVVPGSLFRLNGGGNTSTEVERTSKEASSVRLKLIATTTSSDGEQSKETAREEMIKDIMNQTVTPSQHTSGNSQHQGHLLCGPVAPQWGYRGGSQPTHSGYCALHDLYNMQQPQGPPPHAQTFSQQPRLNQPVEADPYQGPAQTYRQSMPPAQQQYPYAPSCPVQQTYPNPPYGSAHASGGYGQTHPHNPPAAASSGYGQHPGAPQPAANNAAAYGYHAPVTSAAYGAPTQQGPPAAFGWYQGPVTSAAYGAPTQQGPPAAFGWYQGPVFLAAHGASPQQGPPAAAYPAAAAYAAQPTQAHQPWYDQSGGYGAQQQQR